MMYRRKIRPDQLGVLWKEDQFHRIVRSSRIWMFPFSKQKLELVDLRFPIFSHDRLRDMVNADAFKGIGQVLDLRDWQRALVWIDGRFFGIIAPGLYVIWNEFADVRVEVVDAREVHFRHDQLSVISRSEVGDEMSIETVHQDHTGVLFLDGRYDSILEPGRYAFWRNQADVSLVQVDLREQAFDVNGQDLVTSDKVTLRLNAIVTYRVCDPKRSVSASENVHQALYRATQLALRAIVGQHELDQFLDDKQQIAERAMGELRERAGELGLTVISVGVRDVILPGEMKELMNKVIEARKAAEANLISRREETAAIRSQANTAKLLDAHPTLMRLRELEVLEKVAQSSNLQVVLGDQDGLSDRIRRLV